MPPPDSAPVLATIIVDLCASAPAGATISPIDAAKAFADARDEDELGWRSAKALAAVRLALEGRLVIYRKGKLADPNDFRGVYRLGAPSDE